MVRKTERSLSLLPSSRWRKGAAYTGALMKPDNSCGCSCTLSVEWLGY